MATDSIPNRGPEVLAATTITWALAVIATGLRVLSRKLKRNRLWLDDWLAIASLIWAGAHTFTIAAYQVPRGFGKHIYDGPPDAAYAWALGLFIGELAYFSGLVLIKWAILAFYWRIFNILHSIRLRIWTLFAIVSAWGLASILVMSLKCQPVDSNWVQYDSVNPIPPSEYHSLYTTPGLFCGSSTNYNDEMWSDLLDDKAHLKPSSSSHMESLDSSLMAIPGAPTSNSAIRSIDCCPSEIAEAIMDPVPLLSQIQLKLHGIQTQRPPQAAELQAIINQTVQIAQKFIEVLNQILPPCTADSSLASIQQRQHTPHTTTPVSDASISSNDEPSFHLEWTSKQSRRQQQYIPAGTVDAVEIRLAFICYIQILRSYKNLVHMLINSVTMAEAQQFDASDFVPVQIGTLHTVVSPRLQIALLVQLISHHTEEIWHKTRQLAVRINEARPNMYPSHPGAFISNIIGKDIHSEEEDLRDGLDLISERLKMHSQFRDH
ncbi:hypothetical protein TrVFT333_000019 [Trichoderma virens FT-333]|nr:hypothetical protein TrVFT333_000019 [Trichoderma virens FT-333]